MHMAIDYSLRIEVTPILISRHYLIYRIKAENWKLKNFLFQDLDLNHGPPVLWSSNLDRSAAMVPLSAGKSLYNTICAVVNQL